MKDRKKIWKIAGFSLVGLVLVAGLAVGGYLLWERAPAVQPAPTPAVSPSPTAAATSQDDKGTPFDTRRKDGVYTFLLAGNDDGTGNTDTIMVGKLDTVRHKLKKVTIENAAEADHTIAMLMGDDVAPRREFIEENATYAKIDA